MEKPAVKTTERNLDARTLQKIADLLKVISHPVRLQIIELLEERGPICVGDIKSHLNIEQSLLSHHINKMKDKGILKSYRDGRNIYYSLSLWQITKIFDCMENCDLDSIF